MANVYRTIGKDDEALVGYRRLLELDPRNAQAHQAVAQVLVDHGKLEEAQHVAEPRARDPAGDGGGAQHARRAAAQAGRRRRRRTRDSRCARAECRPAACPLQPGAGGRAARRRERRDRRVQEGNRARPGELHGAVQSREGSTSGSGTSTSSAPPFAPRSRATPTSPRATCSWRSSASTSASAPRRLRWRAAGIELAPEAEFAPLGHFVIADALAADGRTEAAAREAAEGRRLAARSKKK